MKKLLALNRGEIAIRILRAANELGLRTVAIYSQEDRLALHRFKADEAYLIGEGKGPVEAYLDVDGIVALASEKEVDAIHPGYGFLSENPALPRACERAGITFIGPSAELLELLGDKTRRPPTGRARRHSRGARHRRSGPQCPPGGEAWPPKSAFRSSSRRPSAAAAAACAWWNARPISPSRLEEARREAAAAFGNDAVFLERFVRRARHIEVQILGDRHGNILHLYERDCSVQRRHQKVVEVAPAVALDAGIRARAGRSRRHAGPRRRLLQRRHGRVPGGCRFGRVVLHRGESAHPGGTHRHRNGDRHRPGALPDPGGAGPGAASAPEMNLPPQEQIPLYGYALQCRITTEDPANDFVPDYGKLSTYRSPAGFGIRLDGGSAYSGAVITPYYDSLLVKTTAWGREFRQACQRMDRCLREFRVRGVKTNIPFLENVVNHPDFQAGRVTTRLAGGDPGAVPLRARAATAPPSCSATWAT